MISEELLKVMAGVERLNPTWGAKLVDWIKVPYDRMITVPDGYSKVIWYYSPEGFNVVMREYINEHYHNWVIDLEVKQVYKDGSPPIIICSMRMNQAVGRDEPNESFNYMHDYISKLTSHLVAQAEAEKLERERTEKTVKDKFFGG